MYFLCVNLPFFVGCHTMAAVFFVGTLSLSKCPCVLYPFYNTFFDNPKESVAKKGSCDEKHFRQNCETFR